MGCKSSVEQEPDFRFEDDSAGELVRSVSEVMQPVRIRSRTVSADEVHDQRAKARKSTTEGVLCSSGHVAMERVTSMNSFKRMGSRMSTMRPSARVQLLNGIKVMHDSGGGKSHSLEGRLKAFGMRMKEMEGDGNCQFRTLAFNLFGEQAHHAVARKAAVAHMRKHHEFFGVLFESPDEFKAYLRDMSRNRTWGDELTLRAAVEAYGVEAHVITSESSNWYLVYQPEAAEAPDPKVAACPKGAALPKPGKQVFLSYISPVHYNSIVIAKSMDKE
mmetsp:Transcript_34812/g.100043  ORF Transcript_34812/g.100043 Transcript_34812/m.100043 type:complete len:274 (-) Transcript_34812:192-1013(-)